MNEEEKRSKSLRRRILTIVAAVLIVLLFAYAVKVTDVNLKEPLEPRRQENLVGLLRDLARPDLFTYADETRSTSISIRMPCPEEVKASQVTLEGRVVVFTPNCATTTQDPLVIVGEEFAQNVPLIIRWYPAGAATTRTLANARTDAEGRFRVDFTMPDIRETAEPQQNEIVEILDRRITGLSGTTIETLEKILETILMALMASTLGTILAVPISFLGARNLMSTLGAPLASIMAGVIALPIGMGIGYFAARVIVDQSNRLSENLLLALVSLAVVTGLLWAVLRLGRSVVVDEAQTAGQKIWAYVRLALAAVLIVLALAIIAQAGIVIGRWMDENLGFLGFIGNFIFVISDLLRLLLPLLAGFILALIVASYFSRYGQEAVLQLAEFPAKIVTAVLTFIGASLFVFGLLYAINWICLLGVCRQLPEDTGALLQTLAVPSLVFGLIAALLSFLVLPKRLYPIGMVTYTVTRTILNILRAIEPVIMGFVLVVWVGIGPFAGIMALMLHSIADLGKLFSEQVENIDEGPLEAVTATGATRIQQINFAVVPQIVPHYTAFIFYRWDINVRMSTIIGFVGGGGIGLILFRSTNLTQYRQAAVMVIAIAIVVTVLDNVSSRLRKRIT